ncbi:hypothetical protein [Planktotalea sp.]|nr:hypothetical protein [Planktotalea sp.]
MKTDQGERPIEGLVAGDMVLTATSTTMAPPPA